MNKEEQNNMDLLRFITSGSVDDGKSTLIGRLMYDTKSIFEDQLKDIERISKRNGDGGINLALLTDGLKAEREQGITIDVAYRYFSTPKRKFIMADTPGHIQYTRNMVTGASTAQAVIILIDARHSMVEQTKRHSYVSSLLGIKHIIVCVNKMDLVDFSQEVFEKIKKEYISFSASLKLPDIHFIPISALKGDNVVNVSLNLPWYKGKTVLDTLETVKVTSDMNIIDGRFPVQSVIRPQSMGYPDFRGYAGRVEGGVFKSGDSVTVLPSNITASIDKIYVGEVAVQEAVPQMSVVITLKEDVDISRGDMLVKGKSPTISQDITLMISWFSDKNLNSNGSYILKHTTHETKCVVKDVEFKMDINTLERITEDLKVLKNDIARVVLKTNKPIFYDSYKDNRVTGSVILIDEFTNETVAAGMISCLS